MHGASQPFPALLKFILKCPENVAHVDLPAVRCRKERGIYGNVFDIASRQFELVCQKLQIYILSDRTCLREYGSTFQAAPLHPEWKIPPRTGFSA